MLENWPRRAAIALAVVWLLLFFISPWEVPESAQTLPLGFKLFAAIGVLLALLSFYAAVLSLCCRRWTAALVHLALPLCVAGFALDEQQGRRLMMDIPVGEQMKDFVVEDFAVEYYPPFFWLCKRAEGELKPLERAAFKDGKVFFKANALTLTENDLFTQSGQPLKYLSLPGELVCALEPPRERFFAATFRIGEDVAVLGVNKPLKIGGWNFYLMSHGKYADGTVFIRVLVKQMPGTPLVKAGLWMLGLSACYWAFARVKRKEGAS